MAKGKTMRILKMILGVTFSFGLMACDGKTDFLAKVPEPVPSQKNVPPVALQGLGVIAGQVTDEITGLALPDIRVQIFKQNEATFTAWAYTNFKGRYEVSGLEPGSYSVQVKKSGYFDFTSQLAKPLSGGQTDSVDVPLKQVPSTISGRARDKFSYAYLKDVQVQLIDSKTLAVLKTVLTDSYGNYSLTNIYLGSYSLRFSKLGYVDFASSQPAQISTAQNFNVNAEMEPQKIGISGTVTDTNSRALASVTVQVLSSSGSVVATATTDSQGLYAISTLTGNQYTMRFSLVGYTDSLTSSPGLTVGGNNYTVNAQMKPQMARVTGTVVDASNAQAIAGARVQILDTATGVVVSDTTTNSYGQYAINDLLAGNYKMLFTASHYSDFSTAQPGAILFGNGYQVNAALSRQLEPGQFRIVLTWTDALAGAVADVDSYLQIPGYEQAPIYYGAKVGAGANLDVDDTSWSGPETVTITSVYSGTYRYYVANYSSSSDGLALGKSNIRIEVYGASGLMKQYALNGGCGAVYEFFKIENGVIRDVKQYDVTLPVHLGGGGRPVCP